MAPKNYLFPGLKNTRINSLINTRMKKYSHSFDESSMYDDVLVDLPIKSILNPPIYSSNSDSFESMIHLKKEHASLRFFMLHFHAFSLNIFSNEMINHTQRERMPVGQYLLNSCSMLKDWSLDRSPRQGKITEKPFFVQPNLTKQAWEQEK